MWPFNKRVRDVHGEEFRKSVIGLRAATRLWDLGLGIEEGKASFWVHVFWWNGREWKRRRM
jgi:hypothetical protein